jgi:hypothetical protein
LLLKEVNHRELSRSGVEFREFFIVKLNVSHSVSMLCNIKDSLKELRFMSEIVFSGVEEMDK